MQSIEEFAKPSISFGNSKYKEWNHAGKKRQMVCYFVLGEDTKVFEKSKPVGKKKPMPPKSTSSVSQKMNYMHKAAREYDKADKRKERSVNDAKDAE